jgi:putative transposase
MRGPKAVPLTVTPRQAAILIHLTRCSTVSQALAQRARLILAAADGAATDQIARQLRVHRQTVQLWRARWHAAQATLAAQEGADPADPPLQALITDLLRDAPRCGAPPTFTPEQVVQIVALACEEPAANGAPVSQWTPRDLAQEAVQRGIVPTISPRTVGRFLKSGRSAAPSQPLLAQSQTGAPGGVRRGGADGV